jgi:hypothetical protein
LIDLLAHCAPTASHIATKTGSCPIELPHGNQILCVIENVGCGFFFIGIHEIRGWVVRPPRNSPDVATVKLLRKLQIAGTGD